MYNVTIFGIDIVLKPIAFSIPIGDGHWDIYWYGIIIGIGHRYLYYYYLYYYLMVLVFELN